MPIVDVVPEGSPKGGKTSSASSPSSSSPPSEQAAIPTDEVTKGWVGRVAELRAQQAELKAAKSKLSKDLKAALRKTKRLKDRARHLTEDDMLQILVMKRGKTSEDASGCPGDSVSSSSTSASASGMHVPSMPALPASSNAEAADRDNTRSGDESMRDE